MMVSGLFIVVRYLRVDGDVECVLLARTNARDLMARLPIWGNNEKIS